MSGVRLVVALVAAVAWSGSAAATSIWSRGAPGAGDEDALAGKEIYHNYCVYCHGPNMNNTGQRSFDLRKFPLSERRRFTTSVTNGKKDMPAWGDALTPKQIDLLWAYIRTRGKI